MKARDNKTRMLEGKRVLLVDDDEYVRVVIKEIISHWIPEVETAECGDSAIKKLKYKDYDFLLFDMRMPDMNGMELYRYVKKSKPHLADGVIFLTGDTESEEVKGFFRMTGVKFIAKPFSISELVDTMYEMMGSVGIKKELHMGFG